MAHMDTLSGPDIYSGHFEIRKNGYTMEFIDIKVDLPWF